MKLKEIRTQLDVLANDTQLQTMVAVYIYAGLRREEALWLTPDDFEWDMGNHGVIMVRGKSIDGKTWIPKTGEDRSVPISKALIMQSSANKHTPRLQALHYPAELDKMCRKIRSEARTIVEETGTNMLYLVFGCLEFYERDDVQKPALAPLIAVPVTLERVKIDPDTRTYIYALSYSGEDVHENQTLREKLSRDFALQLPDLEEDEPRGYFRKIEKAIENKKRWAVKYQLTLGFLSFGKLAIWDD